MYNELYEDQSLRGGVLISFLGGIALASGLITSSSLQLLIPRMLTLLITKPITNLRLKYFFIFFYVLWFKRLYRLFLPAYFKGRQRDLPRQWLVWKVIIVVNYTFGIRCDNWMAYDQFVWEMVISKNKFEQLKAFTLFGELLALEQLKKFNCYLLVLIHCSTVN